MLDNTEATIPTLESQLRQTQNALCVLLGLPPQDLANLLKGKAVIPAPPPQVAVGIPGGPAAAAAGYPEPRNFGPRPNATKSGWPRPTLPGFFPDRDLWAPGRLMWERPSLC